jgi:hypothetical protein
MSDPRDAQVLGHELLLRMLVSNAKLHDSHFRERALQFLDEFLGGVASEDRNPELDGLLVSARARFVEALNTRDDIFSDVGARPPSPTWKQRLFSWASVLVAR